MINDLKRESFHPSNLSRMDLWKEQKWRINIISLHVKSR